MFHYRLGKNPQEVQRVMDDLHYRYGMRFLVGHYLGFWNWPAPNYTRVTLTYTTHSEGGLTQKDFDGARKADALARP